MKRRQRSRLAENVREGSHARTISRGQPHFAQPSAWWTVVLAAALIVAAAVAAYANSLRGPFIFDDDYWIVGNPSIRHLSSITEVLFPQNAGRVGGRPVVALTLAVNYALGDMNVWGYHAFNLAIHILAAWTLLGVVRRTLLLPGLGERFGPIATPLALAVAMLWMLHPLQTQAVTYVIQRTEALAGLFYLLVLYGVIRGAASARPTFWYVTATLACVLGMATKEVMATAPLLVLLYDRTFLAGSFREALRRRYGLYLALATSWGVVLALLISTGFHGGTTGFQTRGFTAWSYLLTQPSVIVHYLRLAFWPAGLCLDYHWPPVHSAAQIVLPGVVIVGLLGLTVWALFARPAWGFLGASFFLILAPSSSFVPILDAAFEHRMYLPLAAIVAGLAVGAAAAGQWLVGHGTFRPPTLQAAGTSLAIVLAVALGILTFQRNADYQSKITIWQDTVSKDPENPRAYDCLALALAENGQMDEAIGNYRKAVELNPGFTEAYNNLGIALADRGRHDEAVSQYEKALELDPKYAEAHNNLGASLSKRGQIDEAIAHYRQALESKPDYEPAHNNLGIALANRRQLDEAIEHFRRAAEIKPEFSEANHNLKQALADRGQLEEAIAQHRKAVELSPQTAELHFALAGALAKRGRWDDAIAEYRRTLELKPDHAKARYNLGGALDQSGKPREAIAQWDELIRVQPDNVPALNQLAWTLATSADASVRNGSRAVELAQRAQQRAGNDADVLNTLAAAYAEAGRFPEALQTARNALAAATQANNQPLAESIKAHIALFEVGTPFHAAPRSASSDAAQP